MRAEKAQVLTRRLEGAFIEEQEANAENNVSDDSINGSVSSGEDVGPNDHYPVDWEDHW